jgi:predicted HD superfamily hydrolase involved in NAD metabolism
MLFSRSKEHSQVANMASPSKIYRGIPSTLTLDAAAKWVRPRNSSKRFAHIEGVAEVAKQIALEAEVDPFLAELAGWLHDACKEIKDRELVKEAQNFGLKLHPIEEENGHLLHGPVAAETVKRDLNITNEQFLDAIREHTLGNVPMTDLSKVVFLADCLEASRPEDYTKPIWEALAHGYDKFKKPDNMRVDLDAAVLVACESGLQHLMQTHKVIHPKTVEVRNYLLDILRERNSKHGHD